MPNIKNYTRYFTMMTLAVEKKITQLLGYVQQFTFKWNAAILNKKDSVTQRVLLENFLDKRMLSRIKSDITVTDETLI